MVIPQRSFSVFFWGRYIGQCISLLWKPCDLIGGSASGLWQILAPSHTIGDVLKFLFRTVSDSRLCTQNARLYSKTWGMWDFLIPALSAAWKEIRHSLGDNSLPVRLNGYPGGGLLLALPFSLAIFMAVPIRILRGCAAHWSRSRRWRDFFKRGLKRFQTTIRSLILDPWLILDPIFEILYLRFEKKSF